MGSSGLQPFGTFRVPHRGPDRPVAVDRHFESNDVTLWTRPIASRIGKKGVSRNIVNDRVHEVRLHVASPVSGGDLLEAYRRPFPKILYDPISRITPGLLRR